MSGSAGPAAESAFPTVLLETRNLGHRFLDGSFGLRGVSLSFRAGEFVIIAGRNGSGKTLLTRHLLGLLRPTEGQVLFQGEPIRGRLSRLRQAVGLVFQDADSQILGQTVEDELRFGPENARLPEEEIERRLAFLMSYLGLEGLQKVPPARLSGGEKRRLAIGGILASEPEILILDEPFANLDYPGVVGVLQLITDLRHRGRGIILITHELEKALAHADRLVIMDRGRVAEDGPAEEVAPQAGRYGLHPLDFRSRRFEEYTWLPG